MARLGCGLKSMTLLKIARMGHPVLRRRAAPIPDPTAPEVRRLAEDMLETMLDAQGIGLAAPQVHVARRLVVLRVPSERQGSDETIATSVLVNPEIEFPDDDLLLGWEGCLSIPGLRGLVPRHARLRWRGLDLDGREVSGEAAGMHARVLQHEVDHLDGILYLDRMPDLRQLTFTEEMRYVADGIAGT
jgi:peptide deformylase